MKWGLIENLGKKKVSSKYGMAGVAQIKSAKYGACMSLAAALTVDSWLDNHISIASARKRTLDSTSMISSVYSHCRAWLHAAWGTCLQ